MSVLTVSYLSNNTTDIFILKEVLHCIVVQNIYLYGPHIQFSLVQGVTYLITSCSIIMTKNFKYAN